MSRKAFITIGILLIAAILAAPAYAQSGPPVLETVVHIVQRGETLFSIAERYRLTVDGIAHANGIPDPRQIYVGQRLVITGVEPAEGEETTVAYVIQPGDTLPSIARRFRTTWQRLAQVNGLVSPQAIYAGQPIQVPSTGGPVDLMVDGNVVAGPGAGSGSLYIVQPGDTLFHLAVKSGVSPWTLVAASRLANPALVYPGQELLIPDGGSDLLPEPFVSVDIQPLPVSQGTPMIVKVHTTKPVALEGRLFDRSVSFSEESGVYYGMVGVHVFTEPGLYELELVAQDGENHRTAITTGIIVEEGAFGYERIDLPEGRDSLLDPVLVAAEREKLETLRTLYTPKRHWAVPFQRPCVGTISSYYGTHRAYEDGPYTSYHTGVDFRAPNGTPVYAPVGGVVVLAEELTVRGNTILIDHGWGVLTGYWHLSSIEVEVGQEIVPGDLIGKVGNTGLSTGAHLHWEVWVAGISVDGMQWLEEFNLWPESDWVGVGG